MAITIICDDARHSDRTVQRAARGRPPVTIGRATRHDVLGWHIAPSEGAALDPFKFAHRAQERGLSDDEVFGAFEQRKTVNLWGKSDTGKWVLAPRPDQARKWEFRCPLCLTNVQRSVRDVSAILDRLSAAGTDTPLPLRYLAK